MATDKDIRFDTIDQFNRFYGFETVHPMISVVRYDRDEAVREGVYHYGLYALFLKENKGCNLSYGRTKYDFDEMTITSFAPGQTVTMEHNPEVIYPRWTAILFHPDFIARTSLGREISKYGFFSYNSNEALHLSTSEVEILHSVLNIIQQEMHHAIDRHSRRLIVSNIEVILNYCLRFYERQFITREEINHATVMRFEQMLNDYITSEASIHGIPTVSFFAGKCSLTPGYFGELVKVETGCTAQDFIAHHILSHAKELLSDLSLSVSQVGAQLGFEYPQHFIRFFKRHTGKTPSQYRAA